MFVFDVEGLIWRPVGLVAESRAARIRLSIVSARVLLFAVRAYCSYSVHDHKPKQLTNPASCILRTHEALLHPLLV